MRDIFIGIDNGVSGAVALLKGDANPVCFAMPAVKHRGKSELDNHKFVQLLNEKVQAAGGWARVSIVVVEEPGGSKSARAAKVMEGVFQAIRACLEFHPEKPRWDRITPNKWQTDMLAKTIPAGQTKPMALAKARRMWPGETFLPTPKCSKPDEGFIDAALIALWAKKEYK
jgi:hypothetical protein